MNESFLETPTPSRQWSEGVIVGSERSQKQNRDLAISMIEWMLLNMKP